MRRPQQCDVPGALLTHLTLSFRTQCPDSCTAIQKLENSLFLKNSIKDSWMNPSSMDIAMDMSIGMCAKEGLFLELFPFFTDYLLSPPDGSKGDIAKVQKRAEQDQEETRYCKRYGHSRFMFEQAYGGQGVECDAEKGLIVNKCQAFTTSVEGHFTHSPTKGRVDNEFNRDVKKGQKKTRKKTATGKVLQSRPQLSQPAQASILIPKSRKCRVMMGSVPTGVPLKKDIAKSDVHNTISRGLGNGAKKVACLLCSTPRKGLKPRNPALRTDKLSDVNPADHHSLLDSKTKRKLASNITELPVKHRRPYLEARDLTPPGASDSNLPQAVYPFSLIFDSKAEHYSKAAKFMENFHHQDPEGTLVQTALLPG
ncbi:LOW QUALITY PROTEIN: uncharacterized protein LOC143433738 [Arvicanthis niloticus]|uniref:LOW QUALITY PROTEIN: uncharacterized protein LOC143433738 n=1 Tax=Arvicanthis niloticus TaxID=61156 RepID=UPI00403C2B65